MTPPPLGEGSVPDLAHEGHRPIRRNGSSENLPMTSAGEPVNAMYAIEPDSGDLT